MVRWYRRGRRSAGVAFAELAAEPLLVAEVTLGEMPPQLAHRTQQRPPRGGIAQADDPLARRWLAPAGDARGQPPPRHRGLREVGPLHQAADGLRLAQQ